MVSYALLPYPTCRWSPRLPVRYNGRVRRLNKAGGQDKPTGRRRPIMITYRQVEPLTAHHWQAWLGPGTGSSLFQKRTVLSWLDRPPCLTVCVASNRASSGSNSELRCRSASLASCGDDPVSDPLTKGLRLDVQTSFGTQR
jgi:hypothetical protein